MLYDYLNHFCTDDLCQNHNLESVDSLLRLYPLCDRALEEHHMRYAQKIRTDEYSESSILFL